MNVKSIQDMRMKNYFIEATKTLVVSGEEVSARKIGKLAGYSYATIYNYFKDLQELQWYVIDSFFEDIYNLLLDIDTDNLDCRNRLIKTTRTFADFYLDRPNIYKFKYNNNLGEMPKELRGRFNNVKIRVNLNTCLEVCVGEEVLSKVSLLVVSDIITTSARGLISLHIANP